jgi:hypothetical protein
MKHIGIKQARQKRLPMHSEFRRGIRSPGTPAAKLLGAERGTKR